jgi:hypothetical protein
MITTAMAVGWSRVKEGQGTVGPKIYAADVTAAEIIRSSTMSFATLILRQIVLKYMI